MFGIMVMVCATLIVIHGLVVLSFAADSIHRYGTDKLTRLAVLYSITLLLIGIAVAVCAVREGLWYQTG